MADVFISYSKGKADDIVRKIADALKRAGISCWYMEQDSLYGTFADTIAQEIFSCYVFLLILDERSNQSEHVKNEVGLAFRRFTERQSITILPVRVDNCDLSGAFLYYLNRFTITSANPPNEQRIEELVKRIANALGKSAQPTTPPITPPQKPPPVTPPKIPPQTQTSPVKIIKRGECGKNVTYALDENGVLTISGNGAMWDFGWDAKTETRNTPWQNELTMISFVKIQNGVTKIGEGSFNKCAGLEKVSLSSSVAFIGDSSFESCINLTSISIPDSVIYIGKWAFRNCAGLTRVNIPDSVTSIGMRAFEGCKYMTSVSVPANAKIGLLAFPFMVSVTRRAEIIKRGECGAWGNNVTYTLDEQGVLMISGVGPMRNFAKDHNAKTANTPWQNERNAIRFVVIQKSVTSIGNRAFCDCVKLKRVTLIPDCFGGTTFTIGDFAFMGCTSLISVDTPFCLTTVGLAAFSNCKKLTGIFIPDSATSIGWSAFYGCENLTSVSVPAKAVIAKDAFPDNVRITRRE